ncbi:hypothetical protein LJC73_05280, partial [Bacteroidales bacterium OttesenSCG-928-L14]|nr:hypothetical protein [Bacteroidales bacterium OttesenSCG-928-L14]
VFLGDIKQDTNGVGLIYDFVTDDYVSKVYDECMIFYENFSQQENDFEKCFKHIKYYYPNFIAPDIYTYISGFDFEYPCVYDGENLFLALDMYLGENSNYYALGIPAYIVKKFNEDFIVRDAIEQIAAYNNASSNSYTRLIDLMIYYGKNWEFIKSMSPDMHDTIITGFTANQLNWCKKNEKDVWKYLLSDNTLFTNDLRVMKKLIDDAPYTSFFSQESPGSVCKWIGWHIVHSYMKNNKISLEEMMAIADNDLILSKSGYRP